MAHYVSRTYSCLILLLETRCFGYLNKIGCRYQQCFVGHLLHILKSAEFTLIYKHFIKINFFEITYLDKNANFTCNQLSSLYLKLPVFIMLIYMYYICITVLIVGFLKIRFLIQFLTMLTKFVNTTPKPLNRIQYKWFFLACGKFSVFV